MRGQHSCRLWQNKYKMDAILTMRLVQEAALDTRHIEMWMDKSGNLKNKNDWRGKRNICNSFTNRSLVGVEVVRKTAKVSWRRRPKVLRGVKEWWQRRPSPTLKHNFLVSVVISYHHRGKLELFAAASDSPLMLRNSIWIWSGLDITTLQHQSGTVERKNYFSAKLHKNVEINEHQFRFMCSELICLTGCHFYVDSFL